MKTRSGFVSNSSSTSFTIVEVAIPKGFRLSEADYEQVLNNIDKDDVEGDPREVIDGALNDLKKGHTVGAGDIGFECCEALAAVLDVHGLVVGRNEGEVQDGGSDADAFNIEPIKASDLDKRIDHLMKIKEKLDLGGKNGGRNS